MSNERAILGTPIPNNCDTIWEDGEWISWDYINEQLEGSCPTGGLVEDMIVVAKNYLDQTGRHLPIYGELGEHYAARRFGILLHDAPCEQGSDGRIGEMLVEIKTISPLRDSRHVRVKKSGNFGALVIVKVDADFRIDAKMIKRNRLPKPQGEYIIVSWHDYRCDHNQAD